MAKKKAAELENFGSTAQELDVDPLTHDNKGDNDNQENKEQQQAEGKEEKEQRTEMKNDPKRTPSKSSTCAIEIALKTTIG